MDEGLSEGHRRALSSRMLIVDSAIVRVLGLLEDRKTPAAMKSIEGSVTAEQQEEITARLLQLQARLASLATRYNLEPAKRDLRRILASEVSRIWVALEDSRPRRLKGYGSLPAETAAALEAQMQEMLQIANSLMAILDS